MIALYIFLGFITFAVSLFFMEKDNPSGGYVDDVLEHSFFSIVFGLAWPITWADTLLYICVIKPVVWLADR